MKSDRTIYQMESSILQFKLCLSNTSDSNWYDPKEVKSDLLKWQNNLLNGISSILQFK